ncbi:WxL protein peptidoglycan domain-containing protein [Sanguibacter suaedae]|uniref:DUF916 domain-containing protein n=1 Tax=Sanguibacter suaedae TaxID=2795737 RepID=A0A934I9T0_9MICO|nr:DUF916 domain-containing protein [Sanguibacter suaedae]MBI9114815.1 DUF916 domain-containing protein [Sanguibacter suaedae]
MPDRRPKTPPARAFLSAVVATLITAACLGVPGPAAANENDVTWGVRTASNDNGADRDNFAYTLDPGEVVDDALVVTNHHSGPLQLAVYPADGFTTASGVLDLVTQDTPSVAVGSWAAIAEDTLEIAPGASVEVPFTLSIPADATPGDYAGGILTSLSQPALEDGITVDRRLGVRLHVRVQGDLVPTLAVEDLAVDYDGTLNPFGSGTALVTFTVRNAGNTRLAAGQDVTLSGPWGVLPVEAADVGAVPELLPGESWPVSVSVPSVLPTFWLTATSEVTATVPAVAGEAPGIAPVRTSTGTWAVPWSALALLVVVVGGVVARVLVVRRNRKQRRLAEDQRVQEAVDRALREKEQTTAV